MAFTLKEKLWLTADKSKTVPDGDESAAFLLGVAGHAISDAEATRLGLKGAADKPSKAKSAPSNKAKKRPTANKGRKG